MALKDLMGRTPLPEPARPEPPPIVAAPKPAPASPPPQTLLGATTAISGQLRSGESLRIDGKLKGEIFCEQTLTIGESGSVQAAIEGDIVVIAGEVQGDITARRKITLERTARVTGDLCTPGIVIQEGAKLEGRIVIGGGPQVEAEEEAGAQPVAARPGEPPKPAARAPAVPPPPAVG
jgi:cytoskeletal protein CcmA (bactofilin family)